MGTEGGPCGIQGQARGWGRPQPSEHPQPQGTVHLPHASRYELLATHTRQPSVRKAGEDSPSRLLRLRPPDDLHGDDSGRGFSMRWGKISISGEKLCGNTANVCRNRQR